MQELRSILRQHGVSTKTPGLKGSERFNELQARVNRVRGILPGITASKEVEEKRKLRKSPIQVKRDLFAPTADSGAPTLAQRQTLAKLRPKREIPGDVFEAPTVGGHSVAKREIPSDVFEAPTVGGHFAAKHEIPSDLFEAPTVGGHFAAKREIPSGVFEAPTVGGHSVAKREIPSDVFEAPTVGGQSVAEEHEKRLQREETPKKSTIPQLLATLKTKRKRMAALESQLSDVTDDDDLKELFASELEVLQQEVKDVWAEMRKHDSSSKKLKRHHSMPEKTFPAEEAESAVEESRPQTAVLITPRELQESEKKSQVYFAWKQEAPPKRRPLPVSPPKPPGKPPPQAIMADSLARDSFSMRRENLLMRLHSTPHDVDCLRELACLLRDHGRLKEAEQHYQHAISLNPSNADLLVELAQLRGSQGNNQAAHTLLSQALATNQCHVPALVEMALLLHRRLRQPAAAESLYEKAIALDPNHAVALGNFAVLKKKVRNDFVRAEELFEAALRADPGNVANLCNFASFLLRCKGSPERAESLYASALKIAPRHVGVLSNYGQLLWRKGSSYWPRAKKMLRRALLAAPHHVSSIANLAAVLKDLGELEEAEACFQKALSLDPKRASLLGNYANFLCFQRRAPAKALPFYVKAIHCDPSNETILRNYCVFLRDHPELRSGPTVPHPTPSSGAPRPQGGPKRAGHRPGRKTPFAKGRNSLLKQCVWRGSGADYYRAQYRSHMARKRLQTDTSEQAQPVTPMHSSLSPLVKVPPLLGMKI